MSAIYVTEVPYLSYKSDNTSSSLSLSLSLSMLTKGLKILKWPTLEKRRHYISLVECYKTVFGLNGLNFSDFFELALDTRTHAIHPFKLFVKSAKVNPYKYSFFVRIVKDWNNLPLHVVEAESFNIFKTRLKSFLNL